MRLEDIKPESSKESPKSFSFLKGLSWFFSVFFILGGLGNLANPNTSFPGIFLILIGLILMPTLTTWLKQNGLVIGWKTKSIIVLSLFMVFARFSKDVTPTPQSTEAKAPTQTESEAAIKDGCLEVSKLFDASSSLSDLQKSELWAAKYKGKKFQWKLEVAEVSSGILSGYTVHFKCEGSRAFISDLLLGFDNDQKGLVLQLQKGSLYVVDGRLARESTLLGLSGEGLAIH